MEGKPSWQSSVQNASNKNTEFKILITYNSKWSKERILMKVYQDLVKKKQLTTLNVNSA